MKKKYVVITVILVLGLFLGLISDTSVYISKILRIKDGANVTYQPQLLASAAGQVTLPRGSFFRVTGTSKITRLYSAPADTTPTMQGRIIYLYHVTTDTLVDGVNLTLAGDFNGTAGDMLVLMYSDTTWKEISRSAN